MEEEFREEVETQDLGLGNSRILFQLKGWAWSEWEERQTKNGLLGQKLKARRVQRGRDKPAERGHPS